VEAWDELDQQLIRLGNGIVNRIIIAQMGVGGVFSGERYWPRELVADWQRLTQCPEDRLLCLRASIADYVKRFPSQRPAAYVAAAINSGAASYRELPVMFAAATGMSLPETKDLISEICALSKDDVYARLFWIRHSIEPPDTGGSEGTV
jgi:hypothetical protein